jgi:hypothetical protein
MKGINVAGVWETFLAPRLLYVAFS